MDIQRQGHSADSRISTRAGIRDFDEVLASLFLLQNRYCNSTVIKNQSFACRIGTHIPQHHPPPLWCFLT